MKILYISSISGNKAAGLTYSVPAQIESQGRFDDVFWYNLDTHYKNNPPDNIIFNRFGKDPMKTIFKSLSTINSPDLVVFQGVYFIQYCKISNELIRCGIPYLIIPRGSLTKEAQRIKQCKKKFGNLLYFNKFISNALAIQYLTEAEYETSGNDWNNRVIIIPNGTYRKAKKKVYYNKAIIKGVFIGRLAIFHKGIDLLIEACGVLKEELKDKCHIEIYGQNQNGSKDKINNLICKFNVQDIIKVKDAIYDVEKETLLLDSDFFILTSRFEGHPMGLIEALSYGLPSLVTRGTNMGEVIEVGNAGWVADNNVEGIVVKLKKLIYEKNDFKEKSENAVKIAEKYNWEVLARKSHQIYIKLLENYKKMQTSID